MNKKLIAMLFIGLFLLSIVPALAQETSDVPAETAVKDEFSGLEPGKMTIVEMATLVKQYTNFMKKYLPFIDIVRKLIRGFTGFPVKLIVKQFGLSKEYAQLITDVATLTFFMLILGKILAFIAGGAFLALLAKNKAMGAVSGAIAGAGLGYYFKGFIGRFLRLTDEGQILYAALIVGILIGILLGLGVVAVKKAISGLINGVLLLLVAGYYFFGYFAIYPFALSQFKEPILWAGLISGGLIGFVLYWVFIEKIPKWLFRMVFPKKGAPKQRGMIRSIWDFITRQKKREKAAVGEGEAETQIEAARKILEELEGSISNTYANLLHEAGMRGWREDEAMKRHCSDLERKMKARMAQEMNANFRMIRSVNEAINILVEAKEPYTEEKEK